jgi:cell division septum initiation protein DivIVA
VRCLLDAGLQSAACSGQTIPAAITNKFDQVTQLAEQAGASSPKKAKRLLQHAKRVLVLAGHAAKKATRGKKPKLTSDCAAAIEGAVEDARGALGR